MELLLIILNKLIWKRDVSLMVENEFTNTIFFYVFPVLLIIGTIIALAGFCIYIYDVFFRKEEVEPIIDVYKVDDARIFEVLDKIIDVEYENIFYTKTLLRAVNGLYPGGKFSGNTKININNETIIETCDIIENNVVESISPELRKQFSAIFDKDNRSLETYIYTKVYNRLLKYSLDLKLPKQS